MGTDAIQGAELASVRDWDARPPMSWGDVAELLAEVKRLRAELGNRVCVECGCAYFPEDTELAELMERRERNARYDHLDDPDV